MTGVSVDVPRLNLFLLVIHTEVATHVVLGGSLRRLLRGLEMSLYSLLDSMDASKEQSNLRRSHLTFFERIILLACRAAYHCTGPGSNFWKP